MHNPFYYEAILQIRPFDQKLYDFIYDYVSRQDRVRVSKEKVLKKGVDLFFTDHHFTLSLTRQIKKKFPGTFKLSRELYGFSKSKNKVVYRYTYLFKLKVPEIEEDS